MIWITSALAGLFGNSVQQCLAANDVPCARAALPEIDPMTSTDADLVAQFAQVEFYSGDFPKAHERMQRALELGWTDDWAQGPLYERTLFASSGWTESVVDGPNGTSTHFRLRFKPGLDEVLLDGAGEVLRKTDEHVTPLLGAVPPGTTLLEIYPDSRSFIAASSLSEQDVRTTGVVALSKWSRLLVTSPRALARGYDWQDTVAHEYIHLVVAHNSNDRAPVWLQEAIAKYLDNRWADGTDGWELSVRDQGLISAALEEDDLVTFDEMHPSLAKLPSAERAALAYAQVSALMAFAFERGGESVLLKTLPLLKKGVDAREALATGAGFADFATMQAEWRTWLEAQNLRRGTVEELPTVFAEDGVDGGEADPVLARREDLHRFVRLGTLLREHGRARAGLVEYEKARDPDEPNSPYLSNMIAQTHLSLNDVAAAKAELAPSVDSYPDFALTHKTLGAIWKYEGAIDRARGAYGDAADLNPYDASVQEALVDLAERAGDTADAAYRRQLVDILRKGGSDKDWKPIHEVAGEYQLPGGAASSDAEGLAEAFRGELAPAFRVKDPDGEHFTLADYKGRVVVVDFWATWCGPCKAAMPHLAELDARDDVVVVGLSEESDAKISAFLKKNPLPYRIGRDEGGTAKRRYRVRSLPTVFVIDRRGRVSAVVVGAGPAADRKLDEAVDEAAAL